MLGGVGLGSATVEERPNEVPRDGPTVSLAALLRLSLAKNAHQRNQGVPKFKILGEKSPGCQSITMYNKTSISS